MIKLISEPYTLQEETMCDGKISTACELVVKSQYINCMQDNTKWNWEQKPQHKNIIFPTRTIIHPCLDVTTVTEVETILKSVFNENKSRKAIQINLIYLTYYDRGFILY